MKEIAYLPNFEICDWQGNNHHVDLYMTREGNILETHLYHPDTDNEPDLRWEEHEEQAWLDEATFLPIPSEDEVNALLSGSFSDLRGLILDIATGAESVPEDTGTVYMENDENQRSERDHIREEWHAAKLWSAANARGLVKVNTLTEP